MLRNYLMTALRHFWRQKGYTLINILGLSVGLACSLLIMLWVKDELSFNKFHQKSDRIHRIMRHVTFSDGAVYTWAAIPKPLAETLEKDYPEVEHAVLTSWGEDKLLSFEEQHIRANLLYGGKAFFEVFTFPLFEGEASSVLQNPNSVVLTASLAAKLFGEDWAKEEVVGKTVSLNHEEDLLVTGICEDVPENSTLNFDYVIPMVDFIKKNDWVEHWGNSGLRLYVQLTEEAEADVISDKIANIINEHHENANAQLFLQPLPDVYLRSNFQEGQLVGGRIVYVRVFTLVAIFILLIACINFMNLATARSSKRAREIGVRKVVGAHKNSLITQFMGESIFLSLSSLVIAILLVELLLPTFNSLTHKEVAIDYANPLYLLSFIGIALLTGLISGIYPALFLSSFKIVKVMKGTLRHGASAANFRKALVIFQFAMSIFLIIGTLTIQQQISFILNKDIGLQKDNLVFMKLEGKAGEKYDEFKQELLRQPGIKGVTATDQYPLSVGSSTTDPSWDGKRPDDQILFQIIDTHYDYLETLGIELKEGRSHQKEFSTDSASFLINEVAAEAMRLENPIGKPLEFWEREGKIIGVIKDFHISSLYETIDPLIIRLEPKDCWLLFVKLEAGQTDQALEGLETVYKTFNPAYPFDYDFLDKEYEQRYQSETMVGQLSRAFAIMAIFISCLGLLGLASFTAEQRTKEIGIRRVLGAPVGNLVMLLSKDFTKLVLWSFLIATPVAYFLMDQWLSKFAFHASQGVLIFLLAGSLAIAIAWLTIGWQAYKAASANPVESLRSE